MRSRSSYCPRTHQQQSIPSETAPLPRSENRVPGRAFVENPMTVGTYSRQKLGLRRVRVVHKRHGKNEIPPAVILFFCHRTCTVSPAFVSSAFRRRPGSDPGSACATRTCCDLRTATERRGSEPWTTIRARFTALGCAHCARLRRRARPTGEY
eukprot:gene23121-biopygen5805